ncbi:hypothetical protein LGL73_14020, partial [Staphylococcus aureus]|uniref:hypothetical protein n=1 Tax=Staphylococcus aureus TaxID=1280 RepID=UPI001CF5924E
NTDGNKASETASKSPFGNASTSTSEATKSAPQETTDTFEANKVEPKTTENPFDDVFDGSTPVGKDVSDPFSDDGDNPFDTSDTDVEDFLKDNK